MALKVGIFGTGWGRQIQIPVFRWAGLEVAAIWARTEDKAHKVAAEEKIPFATADPEALLQRSGVELVSLVTPPSLHAELAVAALAAGKHVLCEKPTAVDAAQAERMRDAAAAHPGRVALIDHELRFLPTWQKMRSLIADGYVGQVYHAEATWLGPMRLDPKRPWTWWSDREQGGGLLGAIGSHVVDSLGFMLGRRVAAVAGVEHAFIRERPDPSGAPRAVTSDDYATLQLRFADEVRGIVQLSAVVAGPVRQRLVVAGSGGALRLEDQRLIGWRAGAHAREDLTVPEITRLPPGVRSDEWSRGTLYLARALKAALADGNPSALAPAATFEDGLRVQRVLDAARESSASGRWVAVE